MLPETCIHKLTGKTIRQLQDEGRMGPICYEDYLRPHIIKRFYSPHPDCVGCEYYKYGFVRAGMAGDRTYRSSDYYTWKCYYTSKRGRIRTNGQNQYSKCPKERSENNG